MKFSRCFRFFKKVKRKYTFAHFFHPNGFSSNKSRGPISEKNKVEIYHPTKKRCLKWWNEGFVKPQTFQKKNLNKKLIPTIHMLHAIQCVTSFISIFFFCTNSWIFNLNLCYEIVLDSLTLRYWRIQFKIS